MTNRVAQYANAPLPYSSPEALRETLDHLSSVGDPDLLDDPTMLVAMALKMERMPDSEANELAERVYSYVQMIFPKYAKATLQSRQSGKLEGRLRVDAEHRAVVNAPRHLRRVN